MKAKKFAELLLSTNIICATISICTYFLIDSFMALESNSGALRSLIILSVIFIAAAIVCAYRILKDDN